MEELSVMNSIFYDRLRKKVRRSRSQDHIFYKHIFLLEKLVDAHASIVRLPDGTHALRLLMHASEAMILKKKDKDKAVGTWNEVLWIESEHSLAAQYYKRRNKKTDDSEKNYRLITIMERKLNVFRHKPFVDCQTSGYRDCDVWDKGQIARDDEESGIVQDCYI